MTARVRFMGRPVIGSFIIGAGRKVRIAVRSLAHRSSAEPAQVAPALVQDRGLVGVPAPAISYTYTISSLGLDRVEPFEQRQG